MTDTPAGGMNWADEFSRKIREYQEMQAKRSRIEGEAAQVARNLAEAKERAIRLFGTDNPDELEKKAAEIDLENQRQAEEFIANLNRISAALATEGAPTPRMAP